MSAQNLPVPKGVSQSTMWSRLVKSERSNKSLRAKSSGGFPKLGNPMTIMELVTYTGAAFGFGALEGKGIMPKTLSLGRTAIDTRLIIAGGLVTAEFVKPVKAILNRYIPKKFRGAAILGLVLPWSYDAGRSVGSSF